MRTIEKQQLICIRVSQYLDPIMLINTRPIYQVSVIEEFWIPMLGLQSPHSMKYYSADSHRPIIIFGIFILQELSKLKRPYQLYENMKLKKKFLGIKKCSGIVWNIKPSQMRIFFLCIKNWGGWAERASFLEKNVKIKAKLFLLPSHQRKCSKYYLLRAYESLYH